MVVESLINPEKSIHNYALLGGIGFCYALLGGAIAYFLFPGYASMAMVFLTIVATAPFMYTLIKKEGEKDIDLRSEEHFLHEYRTVIFGLVALFVGITLGYLALYLAATPQAATQLFDAQETTLSLVNGQATSGQYFVSIVLNNSRVILISLVLSFLYGLGAITVIVWNSSVIAVALGNFIRENLIHVSMTGAVFWGMLRYFTHGIPEIAAYLLAGLAGGIMSVAMVNYGIGTKRWNKIMIDAMQLFILSLLIVVVAALIEVAVTPWFY